MHDFDMALHQLPKDTPPNKRDSVFSTTPSLAELQREPEPELHTWMKKMSKFLLAKGVCVTRDNFGSKLTSVA
jgi:hypothetical protein